MNRNPLGTQIPFFTAFDVALVLQWLELQGRTPISGIGARWHPARC